MVLATDLSGMRCWPCSSSTQPQIAKPCAQDGVGALWQPRVSYGTARQSHCEQTNKRPRGDEMAGPGAQKVTGKADYEFRWRWSQLDTRVELTTRLLMYGIVPQLRACCAARELTAARPRRTGPGLLAASVPHPTSCLGSLDVEARRLYLDVGVLFCTEMILIWTRVAPGRPGFIQVTNSFLG